MGSPRGRIIGVQWERLESGAQREIVPEQVEATIDTWVGARWLGDGLVVGYRKDSRLYFDYFDADGAKTGKTNAIDDYIAAAQSLVDTGVVQPSLLVAETNSAGGPVVGASIIRRPDLFGAAILGFPLLDMVGYENYTHAGRWRSELGSVENPDEFAALRSYSPVHNVRPGTCHPPVLLAPGALDEITPPMHADKFTAVLQSAQDCANPVLMHVSWGAGHACGGTPEDTAVNLAAQLAFLQ